MSKISPHVLYLTNMPRRIAIPRGLDMHYAIWTRSGWGDESTNPTACAISCVGGFFILIYIGKLVISI